MISHNTLPRDKIIKMYNKDNLVLKAESFVERRKLFKNIWEAAMELDEKDGDTKHKVIKTLKLEDVDKTAARRKRQRISNLRQVCTKILDFCDKQEAEDIVTEQVTVHPPLMRPPGQDSDPKHKNLKPLKKKLIRKRQIRNSELSTDDELDDNHMSKHPTAANGKIAAKNKIRNRKIVKKPSKKSSQIKARKVNQSQRNSLSAPNGPSQSGLKRAVKRNSR